VQISIKRLVIIINIFLLGVLPAFCAVAFIPRLGPELSPSESKPGRTAGHPRRGGPAAACGETSTPVGLLMGSLRVLLVALAFGFFRCLGRLCRVAVSKAAHPVAGVLRSIELVI
jgi:hypothetical protein